MSVRSREANMAYRAVMLTGALKRHDLVCFACKQAGPAVSRRCQDGRSLATKLTAARQAISDCQEQAEPDNVQDSLW